MKAGAFCGPVSRLRASARSCLAATGAAALLLAFPAGGAGKNGLPLKGERFVAFETNAVTWLSLDVSPDGAALVIEALGDLYTLPVAGGQATRITSGMAFDSQPRYSPDGERIVFVSDRDGSEDVWLGNADGSGLRNLTQAGDDVEFASPAWAPDGSHIVVSRTQQGLGVFELWAYHVEGGSGVRITLAKVLPEQRMDERRNALGAVYSPDGRYLYYARKNGGFGYNLRLPLWQIARRDLREGAEDILTVAGGSAMRPVLSPDGRLLAYATRHEGASGLRLRNLETGADTWLAWPAQRDEQESRFTRDLFPGYAFAPDGGSVFFTQGGGIRRVDVATGEVASIPFAVQVEQALGGNLYAPYRLGVGPVKARLVRGIAPSPDGSQLAFSALATVYVRDDASGEQRALTPPEASAFHPAWSPDGRWLAWVSWGSDGGHVWRARADGRGKPQRLTERAAFYSDPAWSPDGQRIVALRAASYDRLYREWDFDELPGAEVIWLPAAGGAAQTVLPARGMRAPHFGPEPDRIYLYLSPGLFARKGESALASVRFDGTDRRIHFGVKGPGIYFAEAPVPADDIRLSPDGGFALVLHANQLHVARLLNRNLANLQTTLADASIPMARLTDVGADRATWSADGTEVLWSIGHTVHRRPLNSVQFRQSDEDEDDGKDEREEEAEGDEDAVAEQGRDGSGQDATEMGTASGAAQEANAEADAADESAAGTAASGMENADEQDGDAAEEQPPALAEEHEAVASVAIEVYRPRHEPQGLLALTGATVIPMEADGDGLAAPIPNAAVLIENHRIVAVGPLDAVAVPPEAAVMDMSGHFIVPGYVDTHAHFRPMRRVLDKSNWAFLANLAYGVTTALDVQPSTVDILAYQDLIDAGELPGPRALSTGPGIFNNNRFKSLNHARAVLKRYKEHYRVRNLKAYISGNRKQRQWLAQAARELGLMPTTEGSLDMKLGITHAIDGFSGNEHNFPVLDLHDDVVELVARSGMAYTPTLLVAYGGPAGETHFYANESPDSDSKLNRFTPRPFVAARTRRGDWFHPEEHVFSRVAAQAAKIIRAGGRVGVGSHGQLQGLGYHWELWALASGGLTAEEALLAATRHGAEIVGVAQDIGTIAAGKLADLVILKANPLDDIRHSDDIAWVVKNGEVFHGDTLDKTWPKQEALPEQWWQRLGPGAD